MDDIYKKIEEQNPGKERKKLLIVFDDMIADMLSSKSLNPIVTGIFFRRRKVNILPTFIIKSYFIVPKNIRLNSTNYFILNISNKGELQLQHSIIHQISMFKIL